MAVNNPLNTLLPAAQQPSAASFPGAGQAPSFGPSQQQFTLQNLGQQQGVGQAPAATAPLPQLVPYVGMQPYYTALGQQPQAVMPQVSDPTLQAIQQKLGALQATTPLLQGAQPPHPQSVLAKQQAPMSPLQIVGAAGQQLWQQEVVKPVQDYIKTWQTNPLQALAETAIGLGTIAAGDRLQADHRRDRAEPDGSLGQRLQRVGLPGLDVVLDGLDHLLLPELLPGRPHNLERAHRRLLLGQHRLRMGRLRALEKRGGRLQGSELLLDGLQGGVRDLGHDRLRLLPERGVVRLHADVRHELRQRRGGGRGLPDALLLAEVLERELLLGRPEARRLTGARERRRGRLLRRRQERVQRVVHRHVSTVPRAGSPASRSDPTRARSSRQPEATNPSPAGSRCMPTYRSSKMSNGTWPAPST